METEKITSNFLQVFEYIIVTPDVWQNLINEGI